MLSAMEIVSVHSRDTTAELIRLQERQSEFVFSCPSLCGYQDANPGKLIIEYETVVKMTRQFLNLLRGTDTAVRAQVRRNLSTSEALTRSMQRNLRPLMGESVMAKLQQLLLAGLSAEVKGECRMTWS